jgi:Outer membrane protein beta-barrel domain
MEINNQTKNQLMKKVSFLIFAVIVFSASRTNGQGFHLGIKAGTNLSQINGRSFDQGFKWAFTAGGFAELNFTKSWGIQPEVLFSQTKTQTASGIENIDLPSIGNGIANRSVTLNYLSIPILLTYRLPIPILSLQLGPQFGILMNTSQNILANGQNAFKSGDFSMVGGAQVNLGGFKAGARYAVGLTDMNNVSNSDKWKNQTIQLYVGLRIF